MTRMLGVVAAAAVVSMAQAGAHVDLSKLPAAVRATVEAETKGGTLKSVSKETENGKTQYEVETLVKGKSRDLLVDPSGRVIEIEEEIPVASAPTAVQDALKARGTVLKLERVERAGAVSYEASVKGNNGRTSSVVLDARGRSGKG